MQNNGTKIGWLFLVTEDTTSNTKSLFVTELQSWLWRSISGRLTSPSRPYLGRYRTQRPKQLPFVCWIALNDASPLHSNDIWWRAWLCSVIDSGVFRNMSKRDHVHKIDRGRENGQRYFELFFCAQPQPVSTGPHDLRGGGVERCGSSAPCQSSLTPNLSHSPQASICAIRVVNRSSCTSTSCQCPDNMWCLSGGSHDNSLLAYSLTLRMRLETRSQRLGRDSNTSQWNATL